MTAGRRKNSKTRKCRYSGLALNRTRIRRHAAEIRNSLLHDAIANPVHPACLEIVAAVADGLVYWPCAQPALNRSIPEGSVTNDAAVGCPDNAEQRATRTAVKSVFTLAARLATILPDRCLPSYSPLHGPKLGIAMLNTGDRIVNPRRHTNPKRNPQPSG